MSALRLTLPRWYDLHVHVRQGALLKPLLQAHLDMGCAGLLAMPNTQPPVAKVSKSEAGDNWSIEEYLDMIRAAGGDKFSNVIVPLYLSASTTPGMIAAGAKNGLLRAAKYYPPHGTTGASHAAPIEVYINNGVFKAMEDNGVILCLHGEAHGLVPEKYFDRQTNAEEIFYRETFPRLVEAFPRLKIVAEHLSTKVAVEAVKQAGMNVAASITPQHLLYTAGHLVQGLKYHLYCLPLLKFEEDRNALRRAVTAADNKQFFAGTDSAPHTKKATACGCAAGCFTGGIAPQLYAAAFEAAGMDFSKSATLEAFRQFLCVNGPAFYGLKVPGEAFTLIKEEQIVTPLETPEGPIIPLALGAAAHCAEGRAVLPWRLGA